MGFVLQRDCYFRQLNRFNFWIFMQFCCVVFMMVDCNDSCDNVLVQFRFWICDIIDVFISFILLMKVLVFFMVFRCVLILFWLLFMVVVMVERLVRVIVVVLWMVLLLVWLLVEFFRVLCRFDIMFSRLCFLLFGLQLMLNLLFVFGVLLIVMLMLVQSILLMVFGLLLMVFLDNCQVGGEFGLQVVQLQFGGRFFGLQIIYFLLLMKWMLKLLVVVGGLFVGNWLLKVSLFLIRLIEM